MEIPISSNKSFSLNWKFLQPFQVNYHFQVNYPQRLKEFLIYAEGFAGSWNDTCISITLYSFVPIDIYSVHLQGAFLDSHCKWSLIIFVNLLSFIIFRQFWLPKMSATTESSAGPISPEILRFDECIDEGQCGLQCGMPL